MSRAERVRRYRVAIATARMKAAVEGSPPSRSSLAAARAAVDVADQEQAELRAVGWATSRSLERAEARMAKVRDVHVLTPHPIRSRVNCSTCGAVDGPTCPTLAILDGAS